MNYTNLTMKFKSLFGFLAYSVEKDSRKQYDLILRKIFTVCLFVMVAQVGVCATITYDFRTFNEEDCTAGAGFTTSSGDNLNIISNSGFNGQFAAQLVTQWRIWNYNSVKKLYQSTGDRKFSILKLFQGVNVTIYYDKFSGEGGIRFINKNQVTNGPSEGDAFSTGTSYTMAQNGTLDLIVPRYTQIYQVIIDYGNTEHLVFDGNEPNGYNNGIPYYRYRLSSRRFIEPEPSVFPEVNGVTFQYKIENYGTSVGQKEVAVDPNYGTNGDIMFKNLGWCKVTVIAKNGNNETIADGTYLVEVWDNEAYYEIENGNKYIFKKKTGLADDQQGGVLKTRTVMAIPGVVAKFGIPLDNTEPNTTVVYKYTIESGQTGEGDHMVSFTNANDGWWDRYERNDYTPPTQGTFYSFTATASGKLKFGGIKVPQTADKKGTVYVVKWKDNNYLGRQEIFDQTKSGYLEYMTGLDIEVGTTYFLHGSADDTNGWSPFLLEWYSYETALELSKSYGVASKPGKEIDETITTDAKVTLNDKALSSDSRTSISNGIKTEFKGHVNGATVTLDGNDFITISNLNYNNNGNDNLKGGAIKVKIGNGSDTIVYVYTIPYGTHVWDFRNTRDQTNASRVTDPSYTDTLLCLNMKANTKDWSRVYKVHSKSGGSWSDLKDPLMVAGSKIEGNNALYMSNTAGLIFVTDGIESFGSEQTGFPEGYSSLSVDDQYLQGVDKISATNLVWMKGTSTIYFPGLKQNQYIKIYTYRHADNKGENFYAHNLVDLDGKDYNSTNATDYFKLRGATDETGAGMRGDSIKGAAIFRVPNGYSYSNFNNDLANLPSLTLCDDGWVKIYRIEVMDAYEPDLVLIRNKKTEEGETVDDIVTYDSKSGSVALKKKNGTVSPLIYKYLGTSSNIRAQHANTPRYEIVPDDGVGVTASIENWQSERHVDYNQLKLEFTGGNGNVKIIQREIVNKTGSAVLVGHDEVVDEGGTKSYPDKTPIDLTNNTSDVTATDYVIDKNEYIISVGEITVQTYPYTWDFTNHNYNNGRNNTTQTNMAASSQAVSIKNHWTGVWPTNTLSPTGQKVMGANPVDNPNRDPYQSLTMTVPGFAQGADLKTTTSSTTAVVRECEGLGVSTPIATNKKSISQSGKTFEYEVYESEMTDAISLDGNTLSGAGTITIPEVDNGMYIFVRVTNGYPEGVPSGLTDFWDGYGSADRKNIFKVKGGVYLYQNRGDRKDFTFKFHEGTKVQTIAVTNLVKDIYKTGFATESRDHAIDHTYQAELTERPVRAYAFSYNGSYNYRGYPIAEPSNPLTVVPANTGVVLYMPEANKIDFGVGVSTFKSPLFYPAVNNAEPTSDDYTNLASNKMAPNVAETIHDSETETINGTNYTKFIMTTTYYKYYVEDGENVLQAEKDVEAFYRMKLSANSAENTMGANKAYLRVPTENLPTALWDAGAQQGVRQGMIYVGLDEIENSDNEVTTVDNAIVDHFIDDNIFYSLSGSRINSRPTKKGIYIHNGKKISVNKRRDLQW